MKLTESEERVIVQYIIDLSTRAFFTRMRDVEEMANQLLRVRDAPPVGKNWASSSIKRQPELRTRWTRTLTTKGQYAKI
jgi:hypothetical protein